MKWKAKIAPSVLAGMSEKKLPDLYGVGIAVESR